MLTRVGDEHMGRFVREALAREGVDVTAVRTDPRRLTGLVLLGIESAESFPHIFYRENCADMGLEPADADAAPFAAAKALAITGTHLSTDGVRAASRRAIALAKQHGLKLVARHRLPTRALGPRRPRRRRRPRKRLGRGDAADAGLPARLRPRGRHRGGDPRRRRRDRARSRRCRRFARAPARPS